MKKTSIFLFLIFLTGFSVLPLSAIDSLWLKASEYYEGSGNWRAGAMRTISQELDRRGRIKEEWEIEYNLPSRENSSEWEIVSAYKDGAPASERELKKQEESNRNGDKQPPDNYFDGVNVLPLARSEVSRITARNTGRTDWYSGKKYSVYEFTHRYESGAETAGFLLIGEDGFPRKLEYEFTNLPFYMKTMKCLLTFTRKRDAAVLDFMRMEGHVSAVVFNLHFINIMNFNEYFLKNTL